MKKSEIIEAISAYSRDLDSMKLAPQFKRGVLLRLCKRLQLTKTQTASLLKEDVKTLKDV